MPPLISICVPTFNRQRFLREALTSCLDQGYADLEVLVGDDSNDPSTRALCEGLSSRVRYFGNDARLGQSGNMNRLLDHARGEMVMVLHDDDKLAPGALAALAEVLDGDRDVVAAFGAQQVIDESARVDEVASAALNQRYCRTAEFRGSLLSIMAAALRQQFPNDGYLLRAEHLQGQRFASFEEVGDACDFAFTIAIARANPGRRFHLVDRVTAQYRVHDAQISRQPRMFPMLGVLERIPEDGLDGVARMALADVKDRFARDAVAELLAAGRGREARAVLLSKSMRRHKHPIRTLAWLALSYVPRAAPGNHSGNPPADPRR